MKLRLAYSLAILLILSGTYGHSDEPGKNVIEAIKIVETPQHTIVRIKGRAIPTFNVFKLEEPHRLFVDIAKGDITNVDSTKYVGNGVVDQIGTLQFKSKGQVVGRIIIGMLKESLYDVKAEGSEIVVTIEGTPLKIEGEMLLSEKEKIKAEKEQIKVELEKEKEILGELKTARKNEETLLQK
ncbi:MAG: AMIN domain-containing protein, partial [Deltaproteobacteria bacterium]|nr:AMIN domain-containing protein [Deltaproteobacteria bacterium]